MKEIERLARSMVERNAMGCHSISSNLVRKTFVCFSPGFISYLNSEFIMSGLFVHAQKIHGYALNCCHYLM